MSVLNQRPMFWLWSHSHRLQADPPWAQLHFSDRWTNSFQNGCNTVGVCCSWYQSMGCHKLPVRIHALESPGPWFLFTPCKIWQASEEKLQMQKGILLIEICHLWKAKPCFISNFTSCFGRVDNEYIYAGNWLRVDWAWWWRIRVCDWDWFGC